MSATMKNRSETRQVERVRWVILILFWGLITVPFWLLMQKRHFTYLIVGLFLLVCVSILAFWLTCRGRDAGDVDEPFGGNDAQA